MTKKFALRVLLTVTTGRLLTEGKGDHDNGIGDLYDILGWMTDDSPMTHQLGRFGKECKPRLLEWFPELGACGVEKSLESLDKWLQADKTGTGREGIKMWLAELKMMFPNLKAEYEVGKIGQAAHAQIDPVQELVEMRGGADGIIAVQI